MIDSTALWRQAKAERAGLPVAMWLILVLALVLRLFEITEDSIWIDESFAVLSSRLDFGHLFAQISRDALTPPLHYILLAIWIDVFGDSELSVRSLSALFGLLSVWLIYRLGAEIGGKDVGIVAAFILALSSFHVHYAQEARTYTLLVCLSILSFLYLRRWLAENQHRDLFVYVVVSVLSVYGHFFGAINLVAQNAFIVLLILTLPKTYLNRLGRWIVAQLAVGLLLLPLIVMLVGGIERVGRGMWIADTFPTGLSALMELLAAFSGAPFILVFYLLLFLLAAGSWWARTSARSSNLKRWWTSDAGMMAVWLIVGITVPLLISAFGTPVLFPRYAIAMSVPLIVLAALAVMSLPLAMARQSALAVVVLFGAIQMYGYYAWDWNHFRFLRDWRGAHAAIESQLKPGDTVLCSGNCGGLWYYVRNDDVVQVLSAGRADAPTVLLKAMKSNTPVFYVRPRRSPEGEAVMAVLETAFQPAGQQKVRGLTIDRWEPVSKSQKN